MELAGPIDPAGFSSASGGLANTFYISPAGGEILDQPAAIKNDKL